MGTCATPSAPQSLHVQRFTLEYERNDPVDKSAENLSCNFKLVVSNLRGAYLLKARNLFVNELN